MMQFKKYYHPFWSIFTLILTIIFILVFSGVIYEKYGLVKTLIYTFAGVAVIWAAYFMRAIIFSKYFSED